MGRYKWGPPCSSDYIWFDLKYLRFVRASNFWTRNSRPDPTDFAKERRKMKGRRTSAETTGAYLLSKINEAVMRLLLGHRITGMRNTTMKRLRGSPGEGHAPSSRAPATRARDGCKWERNEDGEPRLRQIVAAWIRQWPELDFQGHREVTA